MRRGTLIIGPPLDPNGACPLCSVRYVYQQVVVVLDLDLPVQVCMPCYRDWRGVVLPSSDMELLVDAPLDEDEDDDMDDTPGPPPLIPEDTN